MNVPKLIAFGLLAFPLFLLGCGGINGEGRRQAGLSGEAAYGPHYQRCAEDRTLAAFVSDTGTVTYCDRALHEKSALQAAGFNMQVKAQAARAGQWIIEDGMLLNRAELELAASKQTILNTYRLNLTKRVVQWQVDTYNKWAESAHLPLWGKSSAISHRAEEHRVPEGLGLHAEIDGNKYTPEGPIHLKCRIENSTKGTILLHPILSDDAQFYLNHEGQPKRVSSGLRFMDLHWIGEEDIITLLPGSSITFERSITKDWYFNYPKTSGKYKLYVVYKNGKKTFGALELWTGELKSNVLEFEIR